MTHSGTGTRAASPTFMADGQALSAAVAHQAAQWLTLLMSGEATEDDRRLWQQWNAADPEHARAWQHIEAVTQRFKALEPHAGYRALSPYAGAGVPARRRAARLLLWGAVAGGCGLLVTRSPVWRQQMADYSTRRGEQRSFDLADGSRIFLDTASAVNVRFDGQQRWLQLAAGKALIATSAQADPRPFVVDTAEGRIRALGTRFSVHQRAGQTSVAVLESAVEITPADGAMARILRAGEQVSFDRSHIAASAAVAPADSAWSLGQIVASDMLLCDFLQEVGRYRTGLLRCDPAVAGLRISGVFPLQDTDRILASLPNVLPLQVRLRTRYWVVVEAAV